MVNMTSTTPRRSSAKTIGQLVRVNLARRKAQGLPEAGMKIPPQQQIKLPRNETGFLISRNTRILLGRLMAP
ncbi:hypothetical protein [Aeromonas salmonicida]|uniref:hypothetical protein n=1 Tax=Aeromonas salmonicida TaxID=645 RepID=UPI0012FBAA38|nr:hypothetical protein [Aeromonas salmonicida]